jgi:hypothetical protein
MSNETNPELSINFNGNDWLVLERYLKHQLENCIGMLVSDDTDNDKANRLRGEIGRIRTILNLKALAAFDLTSAANY